VADGTESVITHADELLPVGVTHVVVQHLSAMRGRHPSGAARDQVQMGPERFQYFAIYMTCTLDEGGIVPREALFDMAMDVPYSDASNNIKGPRKGDYGTFVHSLTQVNTILASNVI
jgi:hypothetical protein